MKRVIKKLALLAALACGGPQTTMYDIKPEARSTYAVHVTNEATVGARVEDGDTGFAKRVYSGAEGRLPLYTERRRVLRVEVGSFRFETFDFMPSAAAPCWRLVVKQPPRPPDGPWPMLDGCPPGA